MENITLSDALREFVKHFTGFHKAERARLAHYYKPGLLSDGPPPIESPYNFHKTIGGDKDLLLTFYLDDDGDCHIQARSNDPALEGTTLQLTYDNASGQKCTLNAVFAPDRRGIQAAKFDLGTQKEFLKSHDILLDIVPAPERIADVTEPAPSQILLKDTPPNHSGVVGPNGAIICPDRL